MNILFLFEFALSVLLYLLAPGYFDESYLYILIIFVVITVITYFIYCYREREIRDNTLRASLLFLLSYLVTSFQYVADYCLWNIPDTAPDVFYDYSIICKSTSLALLGLTSFLLGYSIYKIKKGVCKFLGCNRMIDKSLMFLSYLFFFLFISNVGYEYLLGVYQGNSNWGNMAGWYQTFLNGSLYASVIYKLYTFKTEYQNVGIKSISYVKLIGFPIILLMGVYILMNFMIGERGTIINYLLLLFTGYIIYRKQYIKTKYVIIIAVVGVFSMYVVGITRVTDIDELNHSKLEKIQSHESRESISPWTLELAGSIRPLNVAVSTVPAKEPHKYGLFQMNQIMISFPGFFGLYFNLIGYNTSTNQNLYDSANYLTNIFLGPFATWGIGTHCVADFYLDFGCIGVILGMLLFGMFVKRMDGILWNYESSIFYFSFAMIYYSQIIYIPRSTVLFPVRISIFTILILYLLLLIFNKNKV